jgi:hypothetical protein
MVEQAQDEVERNNDAREKQEARDAMSCHYSHISAHDSPPCRRFAWHPTRVTHVIET